MFPIQTSVYVRHEPVVTWILIALNGLVFFFEVQLPRETLEQIVYLFGVVPARFTHPEWAAEVGFPLNNYWPFLTSLFLHGGWLHIIGNMWTLFIFGRNVEDRMGPARFLVFYLLCGVAAGIVHTLVNVHSTVPAIGASGAIAGVMGAYLMMYPRSHVVIMIPIFIFPFFFDVLAVFYLGYWFLLQLFSGTFALVQSSEGGGIAFWAHVGGFVAGAMFFGLFLRPRAERRDCHADEGCLEHAWSGL